jgi:hypothetical protein
MSYQYPSSMSGLQAPPAGSSFPVPGLQSGPVDAAGYSIKPQVRLLVFLSLGRRIAQGS